MPPHRPSPNARQAPRTASSTAREVGCASRSFTVGDDSADEDWTPGADGDSVEESDYETDFQSEDEWVSGNDTDEDSSYSVYTDEEGG